MPATTQTKPAIADQSALTRLGAAVRARLAADPSVYKLPDARAEIFTVTGFLSPAECTRLIALIDEVARPSPVYEGENDGSYRTSFSGDVDPENSFVRMIERRICDLMGIDQRWSEMFQGQRYALGQEFKAHYDAFNTSADYWPCEVRRGGQRSWTAMAWLNEVEEGGVTNFPQLGIGFPPQPGMLLMWNNARPDGTLNPAVIHAGTPVVRGVKYVITKWFRTRQWS